MPDWVQIEYNKQRSFVSRGGVSTIVGGVATIVPESNLCWHSWDFKVKPGTYKIEFVSAESTWLNFFVIGHLETPNDPLPLHVTRRIAIIPNKPEHLFLPHSKLCFKERKFEVTAANPLVRLESWAQVPRRRNPEPLPPSLGIWETFYPCILGLPPFPTMRNMGLGYPGFRIITRQDFFVDHRTVSKQTKVSGARIFSAEDGHDNDFNDLIVKLSRIRN